MSMTRLSMVIPVYNNWGQVERQFALREALSEAATQATELIVVDDCSGSPLPFATVPRNTAVLRVLDDIPWNQGGARNLGVSVARGDWLILTDVEHFFDAPSVEGALETLETLDPAALYRTARRVQEERDGRETEIGPPLNVFLASRQAYLNVGGVDEDFSGHYGYDDREFLDRWRRSGRGELQHPAVICRVDNGGATRGLDRDVTRNRALLETKLRDTGRPAPHPQLRFRWEWVVDTREGAADEAAAR
ncbi:MAG: glycosyltransferase [Thermomicrobiales bacterium]